MTSCITTLAAGAPLKLRKEMNDSRSQKLLVSEKRERSRSIGSAQAARPPKGKPRFLSSKTSRQKGKAGGGKGSWGSLNDEIQVGVSDTCESRVAKDDLIHPALVVGDSMNVELVEKSWGISSAEMEDYLRPRMNEYFVSQDIEEALNVVITLAQPDLNSDIVAFLIVSGIERNDPQRALVSELLTRLPFQNADFTAGFTKVLAQCDDLRLDTPGVCAVIGKFLARAILDNVLPMAYLANCEYMMIPDLAHRAISKGQALVAIPQAFYRLKNIWGTSGGQSSVDQLKVKVSLLLHEYLGSADIEEAEACIRDLRAPHFHHDVVYQAIVIATEDGVETRMLRIAALLRSANKSALISDVQMEKGANRVLAAMSDLQLDSPRITLYLDSFCQVTSDIFSKAFRVRAAQLAAKAVNAAKGGRVRSLSER